MARKCVDKSVENGDFSLRFTEKQKKKKSYPHFWAGDRNLVKKLDWSINLC